MLRKVPNCREEITLTWLQEAFKQYPFEIIKFNWRGVVGAGIGQMSSLERLTLEVSEQLQLNELLDNGNPPRQIKHLNIIVKTLPLEPTELRNFVINEGFCQREFKMYTKVFPAWRRFQEARNTPRRYKFRYPTCYYAAEEGDGLEYNMILLLEDLHSSGYHISSEGYRQGVRWREAKHVVRELALFHAVGMAFKDNEGVKHYAGEEWDFLYTHSNDQGLVDGLLKSGISKTVTMLREKGDVPEGLLQDLEAFDDIRGLQQQSFPEERGTICHNDLHISNVMIHRGAALGMGLWHDSKGVILDFQGCTYANPMIDLTFFLLLNCESSLFTTKLGKVLEYYADVFAKAMYAMDSDVTYPLEDITEDYHSCLFYSVVHIILGSLSWCFGPSTSQDSLQRYKSALVSSYERSGYRLGLQRGHLHPVENLPNFI